MNVRSLLVTVLMTLSVTAAVAAPPAIHDLDFLAGKWQCKGVFLGLGDIPKHDVTATTTSEWILNNKWLAIRYAETKTKANPTPMEIRGFFTFDEGEKKFAIGSIGSDGSYSTENSSGWEGDSIVFVGPNHSGIVFNGRDTWTKKDAHTLGYLFEYEENGTWKKVIEETCTR